MQHHDQHLDALFHALADRTRRAILMQVRHRESSVNEIAEQFEISLPAVSKHLGTLGRAGRMTRRKQGRQRLCQAEPQMLQQATEWLEFYQRFWDDRLDNLKHLVENEL